MNPKDRAGSAKPNLSILPLAPLLEVIPGIYEGRRKYGPFNWRGEQISETIYCDAAIRHLMQYIAGEDIDPDSGLSHVTKAIAGLLVLRDAMIHGNTVDDRLVDQDLNIPGIMEKLAAVNEKYPDPVIPGENGAPELPPRKCEVVTGPSAPIQYVLDEESRSPALQEVIEKHLHKYSDTCEFGSYTIKEADVGKRVVARNGWEGKIDGWRDSRFTFQVCVLWTTPTGPLDSTNKPSGGAGVLPDDQTDLDIVRVFH